MRTLTIPVIALLMISRSLQAQEAEVDRLMQNELTMTFPSVYFRHNSTEYAPMPYTADSCFRYIALHFRESVNSLVIWRDSAEAETLTDARIEKLKLGLRKYIPAGAIEIHSMGTAQKVSRQTIRMTADSAKVAYLLTQNSVFDVSKTRFPPPKKKVRRRLVWTGWRRGFHWSTA